MTDDLLSPTELLSIKERIDRWLKSRINEDAVIKSADFDDSESRWYVRVTGEEKQHYMILVTLRQRTLQFETYVMPEPEENKEDFYHHFLMRNNKLNGLAFSIGQENAVYLSGELHNQWVSESSLDWMIGSIYSTIELTFKPALRIGFASRFSE
jgi:uncharacterized protein YjfI (DUF2170 family)